MTAQQKKYYDLLVKQMLIEADGEEITAINAAVQISKLLQIAGGAVYTTGKEVVEFDVKNRLNAVLEVIEESSHKVLVFVPFSHTIELLERFLQKNNITTERIDGSIPVHKRSDTVKRFQESRKPTSAYHPTPSGGTRANPNCGKHNYLVRSGH
jgi:SNF2 family DNA or RNA helicase